MVAGTDTGVVASADGAASVDVSSVSDAESMTTNNSNEQMRSQYILNEHHQQ